MKKKLIISLIAVILVLGVAFAIGALVKENKDTLQDMIIRMVWTSAGLILAAQSISLAHLKRWQTRYGKRLSLNSA